MTQTDDKLFVWMMEETETLSSQSAAAEEQESTALPADVEPAVLLLGAGVTAAIHPLLYVKLLIQVTDVAKEANTLLTIALSKDKNVLHQYCLSGRHSNTTSVTGVRIQSFYNYKTAE